MADAEIIQLFQRPKPPAEDSEWWKWGQQFVEEGVNTLDLIVESIKYCTTEDDLRANLQELKDLLDEAPLA